MQVVTCECDLTIVETAVAKDTLSKIQAKKLSKKSTVQTDSIKSDPAVLDSIICSCTSNEENVSFANIVLQRKNYLRFEVQ